LLYRQFSRSRKKNKEESSHNPLFKAFNSTPTLDDVSPDLERLEVATRLPLARTDVKQLPEKRTGTKTTQKCKETKSSRVDPESRNRDPERWKQQLLAWRLSAYEDARQWEMIESVDAHSSNASRCHMILMADPHKLCCAVPIHTRSSSIMCSFPQITNLYPIRTRSSDHLNPLQPDHSLSRTLSLPDPSPRRHLPANNRPLPIHSLRPAGIDLPYLRYNPTPTRRLRKA
jgi:hypothetical protein